jgi:hypothetical protein
LACADGAEADLLPKKVKSRKIDPTFAFPVAAPPTDRATGASDTALTGSTRVTTNYITPYHAVDLRRVKLQCASREDATVFIFPRQSTPPLGSIAAFH